MAIGSPFHERSWSPAGALPEAHERRGSELRAPTEEGLQLGLVRAAIQDGLLMVFGPDGDPVPPQVFRAAAAEQPHAAVPLADGPPVRAERIAAVLDAQIGGHSGSGQGGSEAWIRAMLGIGPRPEMAPDDDLGAEDCTIEVVAFGRELMITSPDGATFLLADARSRTPISLRVTGEGPVALGELVARLLAGAGRDHAAPSRDEFAAPKCRTWLEDDALRIDLPEVGAVELVRADGDAAAAPSVSLFLANGELATIHDLLSALGMPLAAPSAPGDADPPGQKSLVDRHPAGAAPIALGLPDALAAEPDRVALVVVRGLPAGARLSAGVAGGDGSWLLSPRDLPGLAIVTPPRGTSDLALEVAAIAIANPEGELTRADITVIVPQSAAGEPAPPPSVEPAPRPVAEPAPAPLDYPVPSLTTEPAPAPPDGPVPSLTAETAPAPTDAPVPASIPLRLDPQVLRAGGPFDAVIVRDVPAGVTLSAGTYDPAIAGWVLLAHQLRDLRVQLADHRSAQFTLSLLGVCLRPDGRARPRVLARVPVTVD
jgi:hypothetical protein